MNAIINRNEIYGTLNGVIKPNSDILSEVTKQLKFGLAKKLVDTDETLMYQLTDLSGEIKVRKPKVIKFFGFKEPYNRYVNRQYKFMNSLPKDGDKILITWLPDNRGAMNAYIGMSGTVEKMKIAEGSFVLNTGVSFLVHPSGDFNYIRL